MSATTLPPHGPNSNRRLLRDEIRQYLRDAILNGDLKPGDQIVETRVAKEFGTSQAPVREALRELEQIGLVEHQAHRGTFIRKIAASDAWELYTLRAHLETMAARLALPRLTDADFARMDGLIDEMLTAAQHGDHRLLTQRDVEFHEFLCERSGHRLLLHTWRSVNPLSWTLFTLTILRHPDLIHLANRHRPIVDALRARDPARVEAAINDHLLTLGTAVSRDLPEE